LYDEPGPASQQPIYSTGAAGVVQFVEIGEYRLQRTEAQAMEILAPGNVRLIRPLTDGSCGPWLAVIQGRKGSRFVENSNGSPRRFTSVADALYEVLRLPGAHHSLN
jgi:hypothetical protein